MLHTLLFLSICFSDVTFGLFPGETNAIPLLITPFLLLKEKIISPVRLLMITASSALIGLLPVAQGVSVFSVLISISIYLQIIFTFLYFRNTRTVVSINLLRGTLFFHLLVGIGQFFDVVPGLISTAMEFALGRFFAEALENRGVAFMTTEPSHSLLSIILSIFILAGSKSIFDRFISLVIFVATALLSAVGTNLVLMSVSSVVFVLAPVFLLCFMLGLSGLVVFVPRIADFAETFVQFFTNISYANFLDLLLLSGHRFTSVWASFYSLGSPPLYFGPGSWDPKILGALESAGFYLPEIGHWRYILEVDTFKPYSLVSLILLDFWWLGALFVVLLAIIFIKYARRSISLTLFQLALVVVAVFGIFFIGIVGKVAPICILALALRNKELPLSNSNLISDRYNPYRSRIKHL